MSEYHEPEEAFLFILTLISLILVFNPQYILLLFSYSGQSTNHVWLLSFGKVLQRHILCFVAGYTTSCVDVRQVDILKQSHSITPLSNQSVFLSLTNVPFTFLNDSSLCYRMSLHNILSEQETRHTEKLHALKVKFHWDFSHAEV